MAVDPTGPARNSASNVDGRDHDSGHRPRRSRSSRRPRSRRTRLTRRSTRRSQSMRSYRSRRPRNSPLRNRCSLVCLTSFSPEDLPRQFFEILANLQEALIRLIPCAASMAISMSAPLALHPVKRDFNRAAKLKQLENSQAVHKAWRMLHLLSLHTRSSYETCQRIQSGEFHTLEVFHPVCGT